MVMKVGIIGASGFVGGELLRLLLNHDDVEVSMVCSRKNAGDYLHRVHPNLRGFSNLQFTEPDVDKITNNCDLVFTAVPHGSAFDVINNLLKTDLKIIDMSADFRLKNKSDYDKWYGYEHPYPDLLSKSILGIPELHRSDIKTAKLVSVPGCMAVTSILGLAPLIDSNVLKSGIHIDAKVGSSGSGNKPTSATHHSTRYGVIRPYKPVGHRHIAEIVQELNLISNDEMKFSMSTHGVNIVRGILCTINAKLKTEISANDVWKMYKSFYENEPFIRFIRDRKGNYRYPDPKILIGSNFCDIGFEIDSDNNELIIMSATDNLVKGASGLAVQNMNIMNNFKETTGLWNPGLYPV
tara:strand:+ start:251 stop:1306 length:1056 start_codon:yes stop_codon:yes gene_type:complete